MLIKKEDELAIIFERLDSLIESQEEEIRKTSLYHLIKGNLLLILKHLRRFRLKKIEDLSIPDLECLIAILLYFKIGDRSLKEELNHLLDEKFQKICGSCLLIRIEYENPYRFSPYLFPCCDTEILFHYVIAKEKLNKLEDIKHNKNLMLLLRKTYDSEKSSWFREKHLRPSLNKWVHFFAAIDKLEVLNQEEKKEILKHNAEFKINKKYPALAQIWNRVWLFKDMGIKNIKELRIVFSSDKEFLSAEKNICDFYMETLNLEKEDLFNEGINLMRSKCNSIKKFCNAE